MLNKEIINVKNILKIVISVLVIISMVKSCAKAWTWEDMISYAETIVANPTLYTGDIKTSATYFINNQQSLRSQILAKGYEVNDYSSFIFYRDSSSYQVRCWNDTTSSTYSTNSTTYNANNINAIQYRGGTSFWADQTSVSMNGYNLSRWFGLQNGTITNYYTLNLENKLAYINIIPRDNLRSDNLPWYIADSEVGKYYSNYDFYIVNEELLNEERLYKLTQTTTRYGDIYQLAVVNTTMLVNGDTYHIIVKNNSYTIAQSDSFVLSWTTGSSTEEIPSGTITNPSGEVTGNIDLTGIETSIGNIENAVEDIPQNIAKEFYNSGDSGEKGIVQKIYEDLFTVSSRRNRRKSKRPIR